MKSTFKILSLLLVCWAPVLLLANAEWVDKEKIVEHTYSISADELIHLDNQFGEIEITHWNRNEVKIRVVVTASSTDESKAQKVLDAITIEHKQSGGEVSVETKIAKNSNLNNKKGKKTEFKINYEISMPNSNPLILENSFGPIEIGDHSGEIEIDLQFGDLDAGRLSNLDDLNLQFGSGDIEYIQGGELDIQFSSISIDEIAGDFECKLSFCKKSTFEFSDRVEGIDINADHSTFDLELPSNLSADFSIKTSFGKMKNQSNHNIQDMTRENKYGPTFDREYEGSTGSGDVEVKIKGSFSTVTIN